MTPRHAYCGAENCRFSLCYAVSEQFVPPARAPSLPIVRAFEKDAVLGYPHYAKHAGSLTGADVMELLLLAWTATVHTVVCGREPGDLYWVLDDATFYPYFGSRRLKVVSQTCSDHAVRSSSCCAGCANHDRRPSQPTLRSVQLWTWIDPTRKVLMSALEGEARRHYLTGLHEGLIGQRFRIEDTPAPERCRQDGSRECDRGPWYVAIVLDGNVTTVRALPTRPQWRLIAADEKAFVRDHDVLAASPDLHGGIRWLFVPR